MKKIGIFVVFSLIFALTILGVQYKNEQFDHKKIQKVKTVKTVATTETSPRYHEDIVYDVEMGEEERETVTFIMGEDKDESNPYYAEAEKYYRMNPTTFQERLITSCRSLKEIMDYLQNHPTDNGEPYGTINIVVHSNEWKGIGMSIFPEGERMTTAGLENAIKEGDIKPLSDEVVDYETEIIIYGCGLGKNAKMLELLAEAIGGKDIESPLVRSSKMFVQYESTTDESARYLTENWYAFFKTGYRPSDAHLAAQLEQRYPTEEVDWMGALSRKEPRFAGDSYHYYFNVPVDWMVTYADKDDMPDISTTTGKMEWLNDQEELMAAIATTGISVEQFRWKFKTTEYTFEDGITEPAIKVEGKTSILCVLRSMTIENYDDPTRPLPFEPDLDDERFFSSVRVMEGNSVLSLK